MIKDLLAIGLPTITVLVGILLNRSDAARLDARISSLQNRLDSRISSIEGKLDGRITGLEAWLESKISSLEAEVDGRINALESRLHADMLQVIGKLTELEVRVARLETEH